MRYRVTLECGAWSMISELALRRLLTLVHRLGYSVTPVRGGHVITLPTGKLVAITGAP
ncbi:hypothetical protein [Streptomyces sp. SM8]|uniref:hypothetical protein n=1 Tax=Streptomyces sp. SM8 TaxID=1195457 RepID=UPI0002831137|nr:hypothetical protein [Streptomyces sp. SM8]